MLRASWRLANLKAVSSEDRLISSHPFQSDVLPKKAGTSQQDRPWRPHQRAHDIPPRLELIHASTQRILSRPRLPPCNRRSFEMNVRSAYRDQLEIWHSPLTRYLYRGAKVGSGGISG